MALGAAIALIILHWGDITRAFGGVVNWVQKQWNKFTDFIKGIATSVMNTFKAVIDTVVGAWQSATDWLEKHRKGLEQIAIILGVIFGPLLIKTGVQAVILGAQMVASAAKSAASWVVSAATSAAAWTLQFAIMTAQAIAHAIVSVAQAVISGVAWAAKAALSSAAWLFHFGLMIAGTIVTRTAMVVAAAASGFAWLAALGPVGWAIAGVAAAAFLVIRNWDAVKSWFGNLPGYLGTALSSVKNILLAPFKAGFDAIVSIWNNTVGRINFTLPSWVPGLGGKGFSMPKFASGVENFGGGWAWVGERGPELVNLPRGSSVLSNEKSMAAGTSGMTINIGNIEDRQDADYILRRMDQNQILEGRGLSPAI